MRIQICCANSWAVAGYSTGRTWRQLCRIETRQIAKRYVVISGPPTIRVNTQEIWWCSKTVVLIIALDAVVKDATAAAKNCAAVFEYIPCNIQTRSEKNSIVAIKYAFGNLVQLCL